MAIDQLRVLVYKYGMEIFIKAHANDKWIIEHCYTGHLLGKNLQWDYLRNSDRGDDFRANHYFDTAQEALNFLEDNKGNY